jgi:eukaryotic-like serine/threonine-protein kinase
MLQTGKILRNRYKITKILGSGGFGNTYIAQDLELPNHTHCVVKHLKPNSDPAVLQIVSRLFESEAQVLYRLGNDSDQIPRLFAHFEEQGEFYLVQEFVDGEDLSKEIIPGQRLSEKEVTKLLQEILEVLAVVHQKNIIHRDIKPANLMRRHQDGKIVLIDFGAVKELNTMMVNSQGETSFTVTVRTPGYISSEQAVGQPKLCSDVYAVGMLGISALTGIQPHQLPTDPNNGEVIWRNWANVSDKLAVVLSKMVSYHFRERYASAGEALQALQQLQSQGRQAIPIKIIFPNWSRRQVIKTAGWLAGGFGLAVIGNRLLFCSNSGEITNTIQANTIQGLQTFTFETVTVNAQGNIINRSQGKARYFAEDLGNGVSLEMVQIPGGTFTMGSPPTEARRSKNEGPQRQVTVPGFFVGKYPVTQAQYQAIMGTNPARFQGEKRPVEMVSWDDAVEFCEKLSQKTGRKYRLPKEVEWEYACRAGTTTPFYFGETITTDLVNYNGNVSYSSAPKGEFREETTDVGIFPPNSFGLYDMHGNIWEWCQDVRNISYHNEGIIIVIILRLIMTIFRFFGGKSESNMRILCGGSWQSRPSSCRSASRGVASKHYRGSIPDCGFRVVAVDAA